MKTKQRTTATRARSIGHRSAAKGSFPTRGRTRISRTAVGLLVAAVVAAGCNASPANDGATAAEDDAVGSAATPAIRADDPDLPGTMLSGGDLVALTGISSLSQPRLKDGEDGPLPPICGERMGAASAFRWWDYGVVPVDEERQPYAENVAVAVLEFESAEAAGEAFATMSEGFSSCTDYSHRTLALSRVDLNSLDRGDGAFLFVARATSTDEFLHGTEDRPLDRPAIACEIRVWDGSSVSAVGVFVSEDRLEEGACEALAHTAADRLAA